MKGITCNTVNLKSVPQNKKKIKKKKQTLSDTNLFHRLQTYKKVPLKNKALTTSLLCCLWIELIELMDWTNVNTVYSTGSLIWTIWANLAKSKKVCTQEFNFCHFKLFQIR